MNSSPTLIVVAGNACSPMLQQGAACAFEDVIALSELLAKFPAQQACQYYQNFRKARVSWIVKSSDTPVKMLGKMRSFFMVFLRNLMIQKKGPLNVFGWRQLLQENPIEKLPAFIEKCN